MAGVTGRVAPGPARDLAIAALLGPPIAFAGALYLLILHEVTDAVWHDLPDAAGWSRPPGWYLLLVPALAGALVAAALRLPGRGGRPAADGLRLHPLLPGQLPSVLVAALASLAGGLVLGPEGPLLALGLTLGLIAARFLRAGEARTKLLASAGAFAALSWILAGPLPSSLMLFELEAVGAASVAIGLLPAFVAAGTGALVFSALHSWPGVGSSRLALGHLPAYDAVRLVDVAWAVPVAAVAAAAAVALAQRGAGELGRRLAGRTLPALVGGGLVVGALALAFREAAGRPAELVLFSGQGSLPAIAAESSAGVLVALLAAKALAYAISLGAGFRGGPVFPAAALGVAAGALAAEVLPGLELTPAVVAGLAAGSAASLRRPLFGALLAALMAGSAAVEAVPVAILAAVAGWGVAVALAPRERQAVTGASAARPGAPAGESAT